MCHNSNASKFKGLKLKDYNNVLIADCLPYKEKWKTKATICPVLTWHIYMLGMKLNTTYCRFSAIAWCLETCISICSFIPLLHFLKKIIKKNKKKLCFVSFMFFCRFYWDKTTVFGSSHVFLFYFIFIWLTKQTSVNFWMICVQGKS